MSNAICVKFSRGMWEPRPSAACHKDPPTKFLLILLRLFGVPRDAERIERLQVRTALTGGLRRNRRCCRKQCAKLGARGGDVGLLLPD